MNKLILKGRATKDTTLQSTKAGMAYCVLSIAVDDRGNEKQATDFFEVKCFGKLAEVITKFVAKGQELLLEAKVKQNNYTKEDGQKVYGYDFILDSFEFCGSGAKKETSDNVDAPTEDSKDLPF